MKKILLFLFAMLAIATNMKAKEVVLQVNSADFWGVTAPKSGSGTYLVSASNPACSVTSGDVTITTYKGDAGTASCVWNTNDVFTFRTYNKSTLQIKCTSTITSIVIAGVKGKLPFAYSGQEGTLTAEETTVTWTGSSNDVTFSATGTSQVHTITVTYGNDAPAVAPVRFSVPQGTYTSAQTVALSCATEGATIYYQTSGDWADAIAYSAPITVSETTTIYAQAIKGADKSSETSATYTIEAADVIDNINAIYNMTAGDEFTYTGSVTAVLVQGNNMIVTDGTRYLLVYGSTGKTYKAGDIIPTGWGGKYSLYGGVGQCATPTGFQDATGTGSLPEYQVVKTDDPLLNGGYKTNNMYLTPVELKGVTITASGKTYTAKDEKGEFICYNQYALTLPQIDAEKTYNVKGFASCYGTKNEVMIASIEENTATALSNASADVKATKTIKSLQNGKLVIEKAGVKYNIAGQIIK